MAMQIDIYVDWNSLDDTGLPWAFVDEAPDPSKIVPGAFVVAGSGTAIAVAEVVDRDQDGVVHLRGVAGTVAENRHLIGQRRPVCSGLTHTHLRDASPGVVIEEGQFIVVGDDDADPGVAHVIEVRGDGIVLLRVLPGHATCSESYFTRRPPDNRSAQTAS